MLQMYFKLFYEQKREVGVHCTVVDLLTVQLNKAFFLFSDKFRKRINMFKE